MFDQIQECIDNYGPAPRRFSMWDRLTYQRVPKPKWLLAYPSDRLTIIFDHVNEVFRNGRVVWGHILQANALLFQDGDDDCPGELVYSLDDPRKVSYVHLAQVAYTLHTLKGTIPDDPDLARIAAYLTDERVRVYGLPVPRTISPTTRCQISTTFFVRKHLPERKLCSPLLPIVVNPQKPFVAMPLPEKFWPDELIEWWLQ